MRLKNRTVALLLAVLLLAGTMFTSCQPINNNEEETFEYTPPPLDKPEGEKFGGNTGVFGGSDN